MIWGRVFAQREDIRAAEVEGWLREYESVGLLEKYEVAGRVLCRWTRFSGPPLSRRKQATLPAPDGTIETKGLKPKSRFHAANNKVQGCSPETGSRKQEAGNRNLKQEAERNPPTPPDGGKAHGARKPVRGDAAKLSRVDTPDNRAVLSLRYELCGGDDRVTLPGLEAVARARAAGFDLAAIRRVLEAIRDAGSLDKSLAAFCRYKNTKLGYWLRPETLQTILDELQAAPASDDELESRESEDARAARMEAEADAARGR